MHHLSIGNPSGRRMIEKGTARLHTQAARKSTPMDGNAYLTNELHEAYHQFTKVTTTSSPHLKVGKRELKAYRIVQSSLLSYYQKDQIPGANSVLTRPRCRNNVSPSSRHWYDYMTPIMANIGGIFTIVGLLESMVNSAANRKWRY